MKTVVRGISLFLATVLSIGVFAACDSSDTEKDDNGGKKKEEKILTVEEIGEKLKNPENVKTSWNMEMDMELFGMDVHAVNVIEAEQDGNLLHYIETSTSTMSMDGETITETETVETYQKQNGDNVTVYVKDEDDGSWSSEAGSIEELGVTAGIEDVEALFKSENFGEYDKSTGRYTMKEGITVEVDDGVTVTAGYIECKSGSYTVYVEMDMGDGLIAKTTMKYYDFGKASVKLPAGIDD